MTFGERLYQLRKENNLSQEELAEQLEVSRQSVSRWENGSASPDFDKTVHFDLQGFTILGVGNGDSNGHHPDIADSVPFFHGKAQLILKGEKGTLTASCEGLEDSTYFIPNNFSFRSR